MQKYLLAAGTFQISMPENTSWTCRVEQTAPKRGVERLTLHFSAPEALCPPLTKIELSTKTDRTAFRWRPDGVFSRNLPPAWAGSSFSDISHSSPQFTVYDAEAKNILTAAVSDAFRRISFRTGVQEENGDILSEFILFSQPEAPSRELSVTFYFNTAKIDFADAIATVSRFFSECGMPPARVPEAAREPYYSTWYSYHKDVFADQIEAECRAAAALGMRGVIMDDGWQTDNITRDYASCGDWKISPRRFPDMVKHVKTVHSYGLKYLIWLSVPFVGKDSENYAVFQNCFLYKIDNLGAGVLDPRFPEVRNFLVSVYERMFRDYDVDGLKLDFIDCFSFQGEDPAAKDNYAGRDCRLVPEGVDKLLAETVARLKKYRREPLIEFRQSYVGPAIRCYGNMFRAADCPADVLSNRIRTIDLRLGCGRAAVHSDMLMFESNATAAEAALQLLNILFSVPQISMRLAELTGPQRRMLRHYLKFMTEHRDTLQLGKLRPIHPELLYPAVEASTPRETITAVYCAGLTAELGRTPYSALVNATSESAATVTLAAACRFEVFDACGKRTGNGEAEAGLHRMSVPRSGMIEFHQK